MAVSAVVKDGKIQQTAAETSAKKATKSNKKRHPADHII